MGILKTALTRVDALDKMLSMEAPNQDELLAAAKQVQGACGACHKINREGDRETGYMIRGVTF